MKKLYYLSMMGLGLLLGVAPIRHNFFLDDSYFDNSPAQRAPASVSGDHDMYYDQVHLRAKQLMERGRELHKQEKYEEANTVFEELVKSYSYLNYVDEASFLLAEGLFRVGNYLESEEVVNRLRRMGRKSLWEGYALLVLAKIHEVREDRDKGLEIYSLVINEFSEPALVQEAREHMLNL